VLNADNWDKEDKQDESESGGPRLADQETLNRRTIIRAKRKKPVSDKESKPAFSTGGLFSAAFSSAKTSQISSSQSTEKPDNMFNFGSSNVSTNPTSNNSLTNKFNFKSNETIPEKMADDKGDKTPPISFDDQVKDEKFQKAVAKLNQKFVKSVQDFVKGNECVDLQPCFDSYNKHFEKIVECYATESVMDKLQANGVRDFSKLGFAAKPVAEVESKKSKPEVTEITNLPILGSSIPYSSSMPISSSMSFKKPEIKPFSFGASEDKQESAPKPTFNFGGASSQDAASTSKPFTFGGNSEPKSQEEPKSKPFQFGFAAAGSNSNPTPDSNSLFSTPASSQIKPAEPEKTAAEGQPSDAVPEMGDKQFKEEGVVFEIRCKLYYSYEGAYKERGVGTLFVKKDESDGKGSILVRAENHQGTILLNSSLSKGMPSPNLNGTKNILLTCIVNPEIPKVEELTGKLNLFLVKVKTEDNANELLKSIKQFL